MAVEPIANERHIFYVALPPESYKWLVGFAG